MRITAIVLFGLLMIFSACSDSAKGVFRVQTLSQAAADGSVIVLTIAEKSDNGELTGLILEKGGSEHASRVKVSVDQWGNILGIQVNGSAFEYFSYKFIELSSDGKIIASGTIPMGVLNFNTLLKSDKILEALKKIKLIK